MKIKGLCLGDIHFGVPASQRIYEELHQVLDYIKNNDLDIIHLTGDYFDRKLSLNETASLLALDFFIRLKDLCIEKKIKLRVIHGTMYHENNQIELFEKFISPELDMKLIYSVTEETIDGVDYLFVPEEYPRDAAEYYKKYREKQYDAIIGHGAWDFVSFKSMKEVSAQTVTNSAVVFNYDEWAYSLEHGFACFGHIHGRNILKKDGKMKVIYPGCFSRWNFTELSDKGFATYIYDTEEKDYRIKLINNTEAPTYMDIEINGNDYDFNSTSIDDFKLILDSMSESYNNTRFLFSNMPEHILEMVKKVYRESKNIRIGDRESIKKQLHEDNGDYSKYDYILKNKLPTDEVIKRFLSEEMKVDISIEMIREAIKPLKEVK